MQIVSHIPLCQQASLPSLWAPRGPIPFFCTDTVAENFKGVQQRSYLTIWSWTRWWCWPWLSRWRDPPCHGDIIFLTSQGTLPNLSLKAQKSKGKKNKEKPRCLGYALEPDSPIWWVLPLKSDSCEDFLSSSFQKKALGFCPAILFVCLFVCLLFSFLFCFWFWFSFLTESIRAYCFYPNQFYTRIILHIKNTLKIKTTLL